MNPNRLPGVASDRDAAYRQILTTIDGRRLLPGGVIVRGADSRDPLNTGDVDVLRAGLLLGKITASGKYSPAILGVLTAAYANDALTELTVSVATATELVRRIGTTGTFNVTGPPTAAGTVRVITVTYSAVDLATGVITITALGTDIAAVNEVQTITPSVGANADCVQTITIGGTHTGGTLKLGFRPLGDPTGAIRWTDTIAWNATEATMTTSVNAALDDLLGASVVVCGTIADTAATVLVLTFSGTGATNVVQGQVSVDVAAYTGASTVAVAMTTAGSGTISAGTYRFGFTVPASGVVQWTPQIAFDGNAAAINTAIDDALGSTLVVATGGPISTPAAVVLTFSGAGYLALPNAMVLLDISNLTGCDDIDVTETTAGVTAATNIDGRQISGAFVQDTDGSQTILALLGKEDGLKTTDEDDTSIDVECTEVLVGGSIDASQIINYPSDTSLIAYVKAALRAVGHGFTFDDDF